MINLQTKEWTLTGIESVLFDKDGTFIDLHYFWGKMTEMRACEVIKRFNLNKDCFDKLCAFLGYNTKTGKMLSDGITALYSRVKIIEIFKGNLEELDVHTINSEIADIFDYVSSEFYKDMVKYTKPIEEAVEFIKELRKNGIKIGIVTSDSVESTNLTIKNFGWESLFDTVIGRESSNETKESGIPTQMALEQMGAKPESTIMVGDAPMDYISAKNAGIERTILAATGQIEPEELLKTSPYVVNSLKDIKLIRQE